LRKVGVISVHLVGGCEADGPNGVKGQAGTGGGVKRLGEGKAGVVSHNSLMWVVKRGSIDIRDRWLAVKNSP